VTNKRCVICKEEFPYNSEYMFFTGRHGYVCFPCRDEVLGRFENIFGVMPHCNIDGEVCFDLDDIRKIINMMKRRHDMDRWELTDERRVCHG